MEAPRDPIPGTPEAEFRDFLARQDAAGVMERPKPAPAGSWSFLTKVVLLTAGVAGWVVFGWMLVRAVWPG